MEPGITTRPNCLPKRCNGDGLITFRIPVGPSAGLAIRAAAREVGRTRLTCVLDWEEGEGRWRDLLERLTREKETSSLNQSIMLVPERLHRTNSAQILTIPACIVRSSVQLEDVSS